MIVLLRGETTRYNILVGTDLAADLPQVMADRVQLQQVLMNLMINGIEAMKDADGTRELAVRSQRMQDEEVVVSVSASGVGLPPQQMEQIFNAFFYYQAARDRHGTSHQPLHHRIAWWPLVGCRQLPAWRKLLFHLTHQSRNKGMTHEGAPAVFVIHEVAAVRPSCLRGCGRIADNISDSSKYYLGLLIP